MENDPKKRIYSALNAIPRGSVTSYGKVAEYAQLPHGARLVGRTLSQLPEGTLLPWHRVLKANGQIAFPPDSAAFIRQKELLKLEGVTICNGRVKLSDFLWQP